MRSNRRSWRFRKRNGTFSRKPPDRRSPELTRTLNEVLDRRGYQRFYYHAHEFTFDHRWDTADLLNNLQMKLEKMFGAVPVELTFMRQVEHNGKPMLQALFKVGGPLPDPMTPIGETTIMAG